MKSSIINKPQSLRILTVKVTRAEMADFFQQALTKIKEQSKLPGFRAGRVPDEILIKEFGRGVIETEATERAIADTYFLALKEHQLTPVAQPEIKVERQVVLGDVSSSTSAEPTVDKDEIVLEYTASVSILPEVTIKDLAGIKATKTPPAAPTDEEVTKVIDHLRRQKALFKEIDRPAQLGDWCVISYTGTIDRVAREEMKNDEHPLILGEANLIPGFEEQVVGLKIGESKTFPIRFPKEYRAKEVAGRRAEFTVTLKELKEVILPPFDDAFTTDFGFKTVAAMTEAIKKNLLLEKEEVAELKLKEEVLEQLDKRVRADIPNILYDQETDRLLVEMKKKVEAQKLTWEQYLEQVKHSEEDLKKEIRPQAEKNVRLGLALGVIVKEQGLHVHGDDNIATKALDWLVKKAVS